MMKYLKNIFLLYLCFAMFSCTNRQLDVEPLTMEPKVENAEKINESVSPPHGRLFNFNLYQKDGLWIDIQWPNGE